MTWSSFECISSSVAWRGTGLHAVQYAAIQHATLQPICCEYCRTYNPVNDKDYRCMACGAPLVYKLEEAWEPEDVSASTVSENAKKLQRK